MRFSPIQTEFAQELCKQYDMPTDVSTAVLIDEEGGHKESASILRQFAFMGNPYAILGYLALLLIPAFIANWGYNLFAKNRGAIWKCFRRVTGLGETDLSEYRQRVVGLKEPLDPGWGFGEKEK